MLKKMMIIALLCVSHCANSQDISTPKTINWGNVAKATFVSGASAFCVMIGSVQIIITIALNNMAKVGADYKQQSLQDSLLQAAPLYVIPLCVSAGFALIARDYMKKIWEDRKESEKKLPK